MTKLVVVTGFIIAFLAGAMAGLSFHRGGPMSGPPGPGGRESFLANQLDLTADQQAKMKAIWQDVSHRGGPGQRDKRMQMRREQEDAVSKLIRPEDKAAYDKIVADYKNKFDQMDSDGRKAFQQAVEKTKAILTPDQLKKYDTLLNRPNDHERDRPATRNNG